MDWLTLARQRRSGHSACYAEIAGSTTAELSVVGTERHLRIIGPIDWFFGIDAIALSMALLAEPRPAGVSLYIDSPGGDLFDALALRSALDVLAGQGTRVTTQAGALVASAAVPIYLAGHERSGFEYSRFMLHSPRAAFYAAGTSDTMTTEFADFLASLTVATDVYWDTIQSHVTASLVHSWRESGQDVWVTATEAVEASILSRIGEPEPEPEPEPDSLRARLIGARIQATLRGG